MNKTVVKVTTVITQGPAGDNCECQDWESFLPPDLVANPSSLSYCVGLRPAWFWPF